jgi:hypothetical protein
MDKKISVGDMVVVIKPDPCCGNWYSVGMIFTVHEISSSGRDFCVCCGELGHEMLAWNGDSRSESNEIQGFELDLLQKIRPVKRIKKQKEVKNT